MVASHRVVTLASPDSAPIKRLIQDAKDAGRVIDVSCGRRTRSVIVTDSEHVILSAIQPETIAVRLNGQSDDADDEEDDTPFFNKNKQHKSNYEKLQFGKNGNNGNHNNKKKRK